MRTYWKRFIESGSMSMALMSSFVGPYCVPVAYRSRGPNEAFLGRRTATCCAAHNDPVVNGFQRNAQDKIDRQGLLSSFSEFSVSPGIEATAIGSDWLVLPSRSLLPLLHSRMSHFCLSPFFCQRGWSGRATREEKARVMARWPLAFTTPSKRHHKCSF